MKLKLSGIAAALAIIATTGVGFAAEPGELKIGTTLENLQASYNGESNANVRYLAFAEKADTEGYKQVAALFRAAAKAEEIHAKEHAKEIKKLKAEPKTDIQKPEVKSTKENLETALKGETYEKNIMYPGFANKAREEKKATAVRSLTWALAGEIEHAKFFREALDNLEDWKVVQKEFLVCVECGFTTTDTKIKQCPVCFVPRSKFTTVK